MITCLYCKKEFKRVHLLRHIRQVHKNERSDASESEPTRKDDGETPSKRQRTEEHALPGDHWPSEEQLVITTGGPGDLVPWSQSHNLMLLTPSAVCGVMVPRGWTPAMAFNLLGVDRNTLRGTRRSAGPTLTKLWEDLTTACRRACQPPDEEA